MKMGKEIALLSMTAIFAFLPSVAATPESESEKNSSGSPAAQASPASKTETKRALADATRVSTKEAVKTAAQTKTKASEAGTAPEGTSNESDVLEFRPAAPTDNGTSGVITLPSKDSKKSAVKNVHGTVYGSANAQGAGNRRTGGAVGASSKSGKTSVYVETDQSRTAQSSPH